MNPMKQVFGVYFSVLEISQKHALFLLTYQNLSYYTEVELPAVNYYHKSSTLDAAVVLDPSLLYIFAIFSTNYKNYNM